MKKLLTYILFGLFVAGFCTGMVFLERDDRSKRNALACTELEVNFLDSLEFVTKEDIRNYLMEDYGAYLGQRVDSIKLGGIESILESKTAVSDCEAWVTDDGILHLDILQRAPVIHFQHGENGYYVDDRGYIFPLHPDYTADVPTVEGNIPICIEEGYRGEAPDERERIWVEEMIKLVFYMQQTGEWPTNFNGIEVADKGEIILRPSAGDESFLFGQPVLLEEKFSRIHKYYSHVKPAKGDIYRSVNVKYKGQIVCRAKDTLQPLTSEQAN